MIGGPVVRYDALPTRNDRGVHFVVETPRDGRAKVTFDPHLRAFAFTRELVLGLQYPGNWGFVPSTLADDGDPLDALMLGDTTLWPGVVVTCRPVAVVRLTEPGDGKRRRRRIANDRVLLVAVDDDKQRAVRDVADVPRRTRLELARFFVAVTEFEKHGVAVQRWASAAAALRTIDAAAARYAARRSAAAR